MRLALKGTHILTTASQAVSTGLEKPSVVPTSGRLSEQSKRHQIVVDPLWI
jgi:hypothetical protein